MDWWKCNIELVKGYNHSETLENWKGELSSHRSGRAGDVNYPSLTSTVWTDVIDRNQAVRLSRQAFHHWRNVSAWERRKILGKVHLVPYRPNKLNSLQVLSLLQERFSHFEQALLTDVAVSDILIKADQASAVNLVDGSASL